MFISDKSPYRIGVHDPIGQRDGWFTVYADDPTEAERIAEYQLANGLTKVNWLAPELKVVSVTEAA